MFFVAGVPLARQPTCVLVALYRGLASPVDKDGKMSTSVRGLLTILHKRGYPLKSLL